MESQLIIDECGTHRYYNEAGQLHRGNDLPAVMYRNGTRHYYKNGFLHRENDRPAITVGNGSEYWYLNGIKYHENGIAKEERAYQNSTIDPTEKPAPSGFFVRFIEFISSSS
jgi:hypothetical protein